MSMQIPKISVIVPIYKIEMYLHQCIDSILAQSYSNLEIILVDDGSPDNCGKICDDYAEKDNRIKVIHKENGGVSSARNAGLDIATGDYISFVDGDDYVNNNMMEILLDNIISNDTDLVICNYNNVRAGNKIIPNKPYENMLFENIKKKKKLFIYYCYEAAVIYGPWNKLYRRELCGRFDIEVFYGEDRLFVYDYLSRCKKISVINDALYNYQRININSATIRYTVDFVNIFSSLIHSLEDFCKKTFSASFNMNELYFNFLKDIEGSLRHCIEHKLPFKEKLLIVKEGMYNTKFVDIINKVKYNPATFEDKVKYFLIKKMVGNKRSVSFLIYSNVKLKIRKVLGRV
jgi:glycosyltransferase involved in cell wall biosynthesis